MTDASTSVSRFGYHPPTILHGRGSIDHLGDELERLDLDRALVVTGQTVGRSSAVMDPVRDGLGDRLAGEFAETSSEKRLSTAAAAAAAAREHDVDVLVGVGGGSSLDVATVASIVVRSEASPDTLAQRLADTGTIPLPSGDPLPVITVPTTLAGAAMSGAAGITVGPSGGLLDRTAGGGVSDPALTPVVTVYDPDLVATTPGSVLRGSAMNGFDKGVETLYAKTASPVTDATATRALGLFTGGIEALAAEDPRAQQLAPVVTGTLLAEYGTFRAHATTLSLIHSFGHALTRTEDLQQGIAHAIIAPYALRFLFEQVDGRRELLATAMGVPESEDPAEGVVAAVTDVVETLELPHRLRDVAGPDRETFPSVAQDVLDDPMMASAPPGFEPSQLGIETVLESAW